MKLLRNYLKNIAKEAVEEVAQKTIVQTRSRHRSFAEKGRWVPNSSQIYYFINSDGKIRNTKATERKYLQNRYQIGNVFKTYNKAEEAREKIIQVLINQ